jgi:hypothetical protein
MKFACRHCHKEIEITQSERSKFGMKKLEDHEAECLQKMYPNFGRIVDMASKEL